MGGRGGIEPKSFFLSVLFEVGRISLSVYIILPNQTKQLQQFSPQNVTSDGNNIPFRIIVKLLCAGYATMQR